MGLDVSKLENVKSAAHGKKSARCPACAAAGSDAKGEHLIIYPDGKYGCVANPDDKAHRKEIFALAGGAVGAGAAGKISVNSFKVADSHVIMDLGRFGRFSTEVTRKIAEPDAPPVLSPPQETKPVPRVRQSTATPPPVQRLRFIDPDDPTLVEHNEAMVTSGCMCADTKGGATDEEITAFLGRN